MPSLLCPRLSLTVAALHLCAIAPPRAALADSLPAFDMPRLPGALDPLPAFDPPSMPGALDPLPAFDPPSMPGALDPLPAGLRIPFHPDGVFNDPGSPWPDPGRRHTSLWQRISSVATALHEALAALELGDGDPFAGADPAAENNTRRLAPLASERWDRHHALRRQLLSARKPEAASDAPATRHEVMPQATPPGPLAGIHYSVDENGFYDSWPDDELPPVPSHLTIV